MGRHLRNATAIRVNNFNAATTKNSTCQEFNGGTMFESEQGSFSGFGGNSTDTDGTFAFASVSQGFSRASGRAASTKVSRRGSADRIAVRPVKGVAKAMGKNCQDGTHCQVGETCRNGECVSVRGERAMGRQIQTDETRECPPPSVFCKSGDYLGCHAPHKCNSGLRQKKGGADVYSRSFDGGDVFSRFGGKNVF